MNNFKEDLAFSHAAEDLDLWPKIYHEAFPGLQSISNAREDGELQRHGIDRTLVLSNGKALYIDEKVRRKDYGDILLEFISNDRRKTKGWVEKPLFCNYIAYAIIPSRMCYLLPVEPLQAAWKKNKVAWLNSFGERKARNSGYNTLNCPVPIKDLFMAIGQALRISF